MGWLSTETITSPRFTPASVATVSAIRAADRPSEADRIRDPSTPHFAARLS